MLLGVASAFVQCRPSDTDALSPAASLDAITLDEGFEIELVASEPLVIAPVAMVFDEKGRMWVAEMNGYMPDTLGTGEDQPVGRIVILEDTDQNGRVDERTIFLDSLVMPRALCLVSGGLLVAEPPNLWFYERKGDRPVRKTLVDSTYAEDGNVEHQPNGLLRAMDNWIYSAKYDWRYRRLPDGQWLKEKTHFRGQWGLSQDNWGRLYYNDNSSNVLGDFFSPGLGAGNRDQRGVAGYGETIVSDKRVYPIRPTTGVNRGYMEGVLDSGGRLVSFTAACGPLIYRGGLMEGLNAFVPEPAANLIKWNVLSKTGYLTQGEQAYEHKEFLASSDERFRPVNLYNGPDGAIYVLDMYRGIIQHSTYLTPYLKNEIAKRDLALPLGMGRIYRIFPKNQQRAAMQMPEQTADLVALLGHPNGWIRDQAQHMLIDRQATDAISDLKRVISVARNPLHRVHALWTLEGLNELTMEDVEVLLLHPDWELRAQAVAALPSLAAVAPQKSLADLLAHVVARRDSLVLPYAVAAAAVLTANYSADLTGQFAKWATQFADNPYVTDALISGLEGQENQFLHSMDTSTVLYKRLVSVLDARRERTTMVHQAELAKRYPAGLALFKTACQPCHGEGGKGVPSVAPPLAGSEWVRGRKDRLMALVLYGLTGPVDVAGRRYDASELSGEMPGIAHNTAIDDVTLAELLTYIRMAWANNADDAILPEELEAIRAQFGNRAEAFTQEELHRRFGKDQ